MPRPISLFHDGSNEPWFEEICALMGLPPGQQYVKIFQNANFITRIDQPVHDHDCFLIASQGQPMTLYKDIMLSLVKNLRINADDGRVSLILGYMPQIRSDKEDQPRVSIGAREVADHITAAGARRVIITEPHFSQIKGFFDQLLTKVDLIYVMPLLVNAFMLDFGSVIDKCIAVSADFGGMKMTGRNADKMGLDMAIVDKRRDGNNEKAIPVAILGSKPIAGKICVVFDDELDTASTFNSDTNFLIDNDAAGVVGVIGHAIMSNLDKLREMAANDKFLALYVGDQVFISDEKKKILGEKLRIVHTAQLFVEAIRHINSNGDFRGTNGLVSLSWNPTIFPPQVERV